MANRKVPELDPPDRQRTSSAPVDNRVGPRVAEAVAEKRPEETDFEDKENMPNSDISTTTSKIKGKSKGRSLLRPQEGQVFRSNDPDNGGRFIRSGPDGMGGTINIHPVHTGFNPPPRASLHSSMTTETSDGNKINHKRKFVQPEKPTSIKKFFSNVSV